MSRTLAVQMNQDCFVGEVIVESLSDPSVLEKLSPFLIKERTIDMFGNSVMQWHIKRYRLPQATLQEITSALEPKIAKGEWYIHFFSESGEDMFVVMLNKTFKIRKKKDNSWDEMIRYGETVGVRREWTESIPVILPP